MRRVLSSLAPADRLMALASASYAGLLAVAGLVVPRSAPVDRLLSVAAVPVGLLLLAACVRIARASTGPWRAMWLLTGSAFAMRALGRAGAAWVEHGLGADPAASWLANGPFLLCYPLLLAGALQLPVWARSASERLTRRLDALLVAGGGGMLLWHLVAGRVLGALPPDADWPARLLALAFPVGDVLALLTAAVVVIRRTSGLERVWSACYGASVTLMLVADVRLLLLTDLPLASGLALADPAYLLALVAAVPAMVVAMAAARRPEPAPSELPALELTAVLPVIGVLAGYVVLLGLAWRTPGGAPAASVAWALVLTGLLLVRQLVAQREHLLLLAEHTARASEARFRSLVQHSSDIFAIVDDATRVTYLSPSIEAVLGHAPAQVQGAELAALIHPDDAEGALALLGEVRKRDGASATASWRLRRRDGSWCPVENVVTNLRAEPTIGGLVLNIRDVTERALLEAELTHQAFHDRLTGLANRALFRDRVEHALARARREQQVVAVLFLDLDHFKTINDSYGHLLGDELLMQAAARLRGSLRSTDTPARLGGDEFAVLLEHCAGVAEAMEVGERIVQAFRRPFALGTREVFATASVGVAGSQGGEAVDDLLRNADVALYRAKGGGRSRVALFESAMHAEVVTRLDLQAELRRALEAGELAVHYQPIMDLESKRVVGAEALVRWPHPERGMIAPGTFIPIAEESGLIVALGRWVLQRALADASLWPHDPQRGRPLRVTVNLSPRQLQHEGLVDDVRAALAASGIRPDQLVLELTESTLVQPQAVERLHALKALGVRLAVDDFGTGYSSLSYLRRFPLDVLKIDRSFLEEIGHGDGGSALARAIVALGSTLDLTVVAEGIEHDHQERELRLHGCRLGQGFLYARPMTDADLRLFLAEKTEWSEVEQRMWQAT